MAAQAFDIDTIVVRDRGSDEGPAGVVNDTYSFSIRDSDMIETLSRTNPYGYSVLRGVLYVPEADSIDNGCDNDTLSLIPSNVTRRSDLPPGGIPAIAIAPWTDPECVQSYLSTMRDRRPDAAIFFRNDMSKERPPPVSDPIWSLGDGGRWEGENPFPVFAVPGAVGIQIFDQLAQYSGNMSSAPFGEELTAIYDPDLYVRLFARISITDGRTGISSLWVFLIIILAVLLAVVLLTFIIIRTIHRRQRTLLSRRVAQGEVDLEALGIKRLRIPQDLLDKMPQYIYTSKTERVATTPSKTAPPEVSFSQSTCPICLDDFIHAKTTIRELPCNHIFHPECIDPFLRDNSSLCPMCKKSCLAAGYYSVKITGLMVRRERLLRRIRQRNSPELPVSRIPVVGALQRRMRTLLLRGSLSDRMHIHSSRVYGHGAYNGDMELIDVVHPTGRGTIPAPPEPVHTNNPVARLPQAQVQVQVQDASAEQVPAEIVAQGVSARRAWLRERLARRHQEQYDEQAHEARQVDVGRPLWRRIGGRFIQRLE